MRQARSSAPPQAAPLQSALSIPNQDLFLQNVFKNNLTFNGCNGCAY